ncbi:MAG: ROK family protein [Clostridium sp.]|uniref:ROK family protein n=1 Tax=Clostridium sp. TaxID=1506 RepID=UPI003F2C510E
MSYLAFDIGGTRIKYGLLNEEGLIVEKDSIETINEGQEILDRISKIYEDFSSRYKIEGIAISAPGFINSDTGYIEMGGAILDFNNFNIKEFLINKLNINVEVENDANCVALAEKWIGNAKECKSFISLTIGTGIGGAIYINGDLYRGSTFMAGEFGYMFTNGLNNNVPERCTLNAIATTYTLRTGYAKRINKSIKDISGEDVFNALNNNDINAEFEINNFYNCLAMGINNLFYILNPEKILIGGGISEREELISELRRRVSGLSLKGNEFVIDRCKFSNDSGIIGAVKNYINRN